MSAIVERIVNDATQLLRAAPLSKAGLVTHILLAVSVLVAVIVMSVLLTNARVAPANPVGWSDVDFDAAQVNRKSLAAYLDAAKQDPAKTLITSVSVATANFGGIFTEAISSTSPYIGTVSAEAARLQVEAGARALVLDVWPDTRDPTSPVVCAMIDNDAWSMESWWRGTGGLGAGQGRYSNWKRLTRNAVPVGEILTAAIRAAFSGSPGNQNGDPFFVVLRLHGAMTAAYLNRLGATVRDAIGGYAMPAQWSKCANQAKLCSATVSEFMGQACVIVLPDPDGLGGGYNLLPNVSNYAAFTTQFLATTLGEVTNVLERARNTVWFDPGSIAAISVPSVANCVQGGPELTPAAAGFCVVQPSIGGTSTDNGVLFRANGLDRCLQSGAQFVAVNLFSRNSGDTQLHKWFEPLYFGVYSFSLIF